MSDIKDLIQSLSITAYGLARSPGGRRQLVKLIVAQLKLAKVSVIIGQQLRSAARFTVRAAILYIISKYFIYRLFLHPANKLPGPPPDIFVPFLGNFRQILSKDAGVMHREWAQKYGYVFRYFAGGNNPRILIGEPELVKRVLTTDEFDFIKPPETKQFLSLFLGEGILVSEGAAHRYQRKMLNPAFSPSTLRDMVPMMIQPTQQLIHKWLNQTKYNQTAVPLVVSHDLGLLTLSIIARAGFGTDFNSVQNPQQHPISRAYTDLLAGDSPVEALFAMLFPWAHKLPAPRAIQVRRDIRLLKEETRLMVMQAATRKDLSEKKDLLALMMRATDEETGKKLTVKELQDQCLTFLAAGHETTSVAVSWCLHTLANHTDIQDALRAEVTQALSHLTPDNDDVATFPTFDEINRLPLLNNVCKESMRFTPPVPMTNRQATKDFELQGNIYPKGTRLVICPMVSHFDKRHWGDDVDEFKPDRWDVEPAASISPYVYLPFLAGGRQCIGYRFALLEFKIVLAMLIMNFKFSQKPGFKVRKGLQITLRPLPNMTLMVERV
ncbi:cytochrome P450 [Gongronella butleri]|nr:cytochrome P450 [Gongronella butleri]